MNLSNYFTHFMTTSLMITFLGDYFKLQYSTFYFISKDFKSQASSIIWFPALVFLEERALSKGSFLLPSSSKEEKLLTYKAFSSAGINKYHKYY